MKIRELAEAEPGCGLARLSGGAMEFRYATEPGTPGRPNEDYVVCGVDWMAVLDGATAPAGVDSGCVHDVPWLVRRLASAVAARMPLGSRARTLDSGGGGAAGSARMPLGGRARTPDFGGSATAGGARMPLDDRARPGMPLDDLLAAAITDVRGAHGGACDLANPDSPSATVSLCRLTGSTLEYLVLADSPIVIRSPDGGIKVLRDDALDRLPGGRPYTLELVRRTRNRPGGFWVASTVPDAAYHALRGTAALAPGAEVAVLTDGASRFSEMFGRPWESLFSLLREDGPRALIAAVRALEAEDPPPGAKPHDDATAVYAIHDVDLDR